MLEAGRVNGSAGIQDRRLRRLYEYWGEIRGDRRAPARTDINPTEIPDLLGYVNIFEVQDTPRDFRVRLHGTEVARMLGQEITGKWLSDVFSGEDAERCRQAFDICVDEWMPSIVQTSLAFCGKPHAAQTFVALPLSADGRRVDTIITAHSFHVLEAPFEPLPFRHVSRG
ncbi:MAG: PAS domain-containing protein [Alphaproteobacteria bacterium]|nr:PAS domain-containing protein [Alphaproteobacteria bacterium]